MSNKILPSPKMDVVFHSLFRQGNENITKALISAIIDFQINSIDLSQDKHTITKLPKDKLGILDLKAVLNDNTICNIEIQLMDKKDTVSRMLFYWSNIFSCQMEKGDNYNKINKTISIAILDYDLPETSFIDSPHTIWKIRNNLNQTILTNLFELHIISIPKALKYLQTHPEDIISQWMLFLSEPNHKEVLNIMKSNAEIDEAMKKLEEITADKELMRIIELRKKAIRDYNSGIENAAEEGAKKGFEIGMEDGIKKGTKEGMKQGMKQGVEQGIKQKATEIAKKMLNKKIEIKEIAELTGLSEEEIKKIKI